MKPGRQIVTVADMTHIYAMTSSSPLGRGEAGRIRERFERLLAAGVAIFSQHELKHVLQQIVDAAREVVGARYAALGVLGSEGTSLVEFVTSGIDDAARQRIGNLPRGHGLLGAVIQEGKPIRSSDINQHPLRYGFPPHHPPMTSFLGVPVKGRRGVFGNLYLTEKLDAAEFSDEDETIAVLLASQAAVAVENARLHGEREQLVGQIRAMQRQRDLFFAMMNHELRNALTGVYGWAERLVRRKSPEDSQQAAQEVYEAADRTILLLNNFLDLMRLDAGKVRPVLRDVETRVAVQRAIASSEPAAAGKGIRLEPSFGGARETLHTDPVRLDQILVNLLSNAIRHSPERATIQVAVGATEDRVSFSVIDHGPGVPSELRQKIFEPFERFDPHSGHGTGLGLPVSRGLAEALGGTLVVEGTTGGGATFILKIPSRSL
jgi:signal transduction histidine kinase